MRSIFKIMSALFEAFQQNWTWNVGFAVTVATLVVAGPAMADPICPPIGSDSTCGTLITISDQGASVTSTGQPPYDDIEDTLVGVLNASSQPVKSLRLTSFEDIFGFDGDGIDAYGAPGNVQDSSGYGGPNVYFSNINEAQTSGVVNFNTPLVPGQSAFFSLEGSVGSATSCSAVVNGAVSGPSLGGRTFKNGFFLNPTTISASFTPNFGFTLSDAAALCGFTKFDWIQKITALPDPSPFYQCLDANCSSQLQLISSSTPFNDPPPYGYSYCFNTFCGTNYPFYYDATILDSACATYATLDGPCLTAVISGNTMNFFDSPADPCLPGGDSTGIQGCDGDNAPSGSQIAFVTDLAGVLPDGSALDLGIGFGWTDNFNGQSSFGFNGGVSTASNLLVDPDSGTGGIVPIDVVTTTDYVYNGIDVSDVTAAAPEPEAILLFGGGVLAYFVSMRLRRLIARI